MNTTKATQAGAVRKGDARAIVTKEKKPSVLHTSAVMVVEDVTKLKLKRISKTIKLEQKVVAPTSPAVKPGPVQMKAATKSDAHRVTLSNNQKAPAKANTTSQTIATATGKNKK
ncbi:unnamed protein product [Orchesella dallaii]|uniref:Uncharacterized protein n=1 Tax=Orchesella dallaii TaxID=48710 RepID=A0ABP1RPR2_9HEXA